MSGDAYHITAPAEGHDGAFRSMQRSNEERRIRARRLQYVNAHGTSTPLGDDLELEAVERLFGDAARGLAMSSTKSATGHLLGAAGAVEAIFSILAIRDGVAPPTLNLDAPSRESVIDRVANDRAGTADQHGAVQQLRLRRHQRLRHLPRRLTLAAGGRDETGRVHLTELVHLAAKRLTHRDIKRRSNVLRESRLCACRQAIASSRRSSQ